MNKKINLQLSIFNFQLLIVVLLFSAGCHFTNTDIPPLPSPTSDSLWTPTGDAQLDSMLQLAAVAPQDTNLALLYDEIGLTYMNYDLEKAKEYFLRTKALSEELNYNQGYYYYAADYTSILYMEGHIDSAIVIHLQALELAKEEENELQIAKTLFNIGNCYNYKKWGKTALEYYYEVLPIFEKKGELRHLAHAYSVMGIVYDDLKMLKESLQYHEKALELLRDEQNHEKVDALINYSYSLMTNERLEEAENCLLEAQRIAIEVNYPYSLIQINSNLGGIALRRYDWKTTEMYFHKVLELALEFGNVEGYCAATRTLAYLESYKGNFHKAEEYILDVLEYANEYDLPTEKRDCYIFLGDLSFARHDAITYRIYAGKADSISQAITSQRIMQDSKEMDVKYETAKKDFEIEHQQNIIARQTMQRWLFVGGIGALVIILIIFWYMLRLRARRNRELAEINLTKDKLFNIISHDLRNPAIAQRDTLLALVKNARIWDADTLANYHVELLKSAEGEVELIYNLLKWAQLQTGRIACNPEVFPLSDFHPSLSLIHKMAESKEITLDVRIPENALITGDYNILITVIRNLLTNAIKFTASGGTVTLDISPYKTTQYTISISDTGTGISKKQLHDLFRLDNSHSNTGTAGEQGTGLGLIVCKELLERHGGKLYVESEEGKGSRFWFIVEANSKL